MHDNLKAARLRASYLWPYFSTGLFALTFRKSEYTDTLAISERWVVAYNEEYCEKRETEKLAADLAHELLHVIRDHHSRRQNRDMILVTPEGLQVSGWNICTDAEINDDIRAMSQMPTDWANDAIQPENFDWPTGDLAEVYYELLDKEMEDRPGVKKCCGGGSGAGANPLEDEKSEEGPRDTGDAGSSRGPRPGLDPASREATKRKVAQDIKDHEKARGNVPSGLVRLADSILDVKIPTHLLIAHSVRNHSTEIQRGKTDYTWRRPSRREYGDHGELIAPAMITYHPKVGIIIDTSASMSSKDLGEALGAVRQACASLGRAEVYSGDTQIETRQSVYKAQDVRLMGGGGTSMRTLFYDVQENENVDVIIIVTDGYTDWPEENIRTRLVWVITRSGIHDPYPNVPGDWVFCKRGG